MSSPNSSVGYNCPNLNLPRSWQVILLLLCSVCFLLAVSGNTLVLLAVYKTRSLRNTSMYFLASLSVADLMVGFIMVPLYILILVVILDVPSFPKDVQYSVTQVENFFWVSTLTATTLSLCSVSIDRFIAVNYSLRYREIVTAGRCFAAILAIWIVSFTFGGVLFTLGGDYNKRKIFWVVCFIISVGIPFFVIVFCNIKLAIEAGRHVRLIHHTSVRSREASEKESSSNVITRAKNTKATITAIIVSGIFFVLFFPQLIVYILLLVSEDLCFTLRLQLVYFWVAIVSFLHSAVNPFIYCIRSREFRKAIGRQVLCQG